MSNATDRLLEVAQKWRVREPDEAFVQVIDFLISRGNFAELSAYFAEELHFGTAGLRGAVGWGSGRINDAMVARTSWALGQFLMGRAAEHTRPSPTVIVGFDARPDSNRLARVACEILSGLGFITRCALSPVPTPFIAFLVRDLRAYAGIVITASHNPRGDNGMKVYDDQGVQISSPWDTEIAEFIPHFPPLRTLSRNEQNIRSLSDEDSQRYLDYVDAVARTQVPADSERLFSIAYTPLHGVAQSWVKRALAVCVPHTELICVSEQAEPDGTFPTIPFPNPEEDGALELLLNTASRENCELALANDPDGDRLAACIRDPKGHLIQLSGDALGLLFADVCLRATRLVQPVLVSTVVSSPALESLAAGRNAKVIRTLTGFKWLCRAALREPEFAFAYEEALGYCFTPPPGYTGVMDKDGIVSAAILARLLSESDHAHGIFDRLSQLYRELGLWTSLSVSRRFVDGATLSAQATMARYMNQLRDQGPQLSESWTLISFQDYLVGAELRPDYLGAQDLLSYELKSSTAQVQEPDFARVLIRPSGTEAKLKAYVHLRARLDGTEHFTIVDQRLQTIARKIGENFLSFS